MSAPGRLCPLRYRYGPDAIAQAPERSAETLYVIGGLYGNLPALEAIEAMAHREPNEVTLCFNGDFNWFNIDDAGFRAVNERVLRHDAILGNVEAELGSESSDAGCGCAYPERVDEGTVERSNRIHAALKSTAARHSDVLAGLNALPMIARYRVGEARVGVVHGDAESLAGWRFDVSALDDPNENGWRAEAFARAEVDVFASTHTCLPATRTFNFDGSRAVANNGAAGMPNFRGTRYGVVTRISTSLAPDRARLYGTRIGFLRIDAVRVAYDHERWIQMFRSNWPRGTPAYTSYYRRIETGPEYEPARSVPPDKACALAHRAALPPCKTSPQPWA